VTHFKPNRRDLEFTLFEVFDRAAVLGAGPFAEMDAPTARDVLREVERLAVTRLAPALLDADRAPPVFDPEQQTVTLPDSLTAAYSAYVDAEWWRLDLPEELGGCLAPPSLRWAVAELILGANPAVHMYGCGFSFAAIIHRLGTPAQQALARTMVERRWAATMVLTEPDAGSDVGAGRTRALPQPDGSWHIEGVKRFITSGEWDWPENIVHLVLARPSEASPGSKGLSLFLVPKQICDWATGELLGRNGVYASSLEHKMGLKASATCELTFGAREPAVGYLLGNVHDGIRQMFEVIQYARMMVGAKAMATLSSGYLHALHYARTRVQGADLAELTDKAAPRVPIIRHPDVRRSLMTQKAYAEGLRALVLYTATIQDEIVLAQHNGADTGALVARADLLLPVVKGFGSEQACRLLAGETLQTFGGAGYLQDHPIEQYVRDAKIDTLYEGTTAIQGLDLFFRKVLRDGGRAFAALLEDVQEFAKGHEGNGALTVERDLLAAAVGDVRGIADAMAAATAASSGNPCSVYRAGQNTTRLLMALGDLLVGWLLLRQATVALAALDRDGPDRDFYAGKVAAARFFSRTVLPALHAQRLVAERTDNVLMDLPAEAF